jgi:uncharacterized membrane protein YcjF (UPF0283 family)
MKIAQKCKLIVIIISGGLMNVFMHKVESKQEFSLKIRENDQKSVDKTFQKTQVEIKEIPKATIKAKLDSQNLLQNSEKDLERPVNYKEETKERPEIIELNEFDMLSPSSDEDRREIKFHRSPRNLNEVEFAERLNQSQGDKHKEALSSQPQSVERIVSNIPREYFRIENKYESIDAVLDHISRKRESFMNSLNSSPHTKHISKTIEPIINSVSPHAREMHFKHSTVDPPSHIEDHVNVSIKYKSKMSSSKESVRREELKGDKSVEK